MSDVASKTVDLTSHKPRTALAFVSDQESEGVIRQSLSDFGLQDVEVAAGDVNTATVALGRRSSPRLLIVDISGVDNPSALLGKLAQVCEPGTGVIVVGEQQRHPIVPRTQKYGHRRVFLQAAHQKSSRQCMQCRSERRLHTACAASAPADLFLCSECEVELERQRLPSVRLGTWPRCTSVGCC